MVSSTVHYAVHQANAEGLEKKSILFVWYAHCTCVDPTKNIIPLFSASNILPSFNRIIKYFYYKYNHSAKKLGLFGQMVWSLGWQKFISLLSSVFWQSILNTGAYVCVFPIFTKIWQSKNRPIDFNQLLTTDGKLIKFSQSRPYIIFI